MTDPQPLSCSTARARPCPALHSEETHTFSGHHNVLCPNQHINMPDSHNPDIRTSYCS